MRERGVLPEEHQRLVLVRQPGQARAHQLQNRVPRLVIHRRVNVTIVLSARGDPKKIFFQPQSTLCLFLSILFGWEHLDS